MDSNPYKYHINPKGNPTYYFWWGHAEWQRDKKKFKIGPGNRLTILQFCRIQHWLIRRHK